LGDGFIWDDSEFGHLFWQGVSELCLYYKGREAEILTDLEWIDELVFDERGVCSTQKARKVKCNHDDLLIDEIVENERSKMLTTVDGLYNKLLNPVDIQALQSENSELKARCEALTLRNEELSKIDTFQMNEHAQLVRDYMTANHELNEAKASALEYQRKYHEQMINATQARSDYYELKSRTFWQRLLNK
jgi:hypothetical protein